VAIVLVGTALVGADGDDPTTTPAPTEAPSEGATPPSTGALPALLLECFADRGYEIESPDQIHQAPQQIVDECFGQLHEGGAAP